jgi:hypothetical protein
MVSLCSRFKRDSAPTTTNHSKPQQQTVGYQVSKVNIYIKPYPKGHKGALGPSHFTSLISSKHPSMTLVDVSAGSKYLTADEANGKVLFNATFLRDCA